MTTTDAIKHFGSAAKIAAALGLSKAAVSKWGKRPPRLRQFEIEAMTAGALKADQKNPVPANRA